MAIQKSKTLPNGSSGNYWKITRLSVDKQAMIVSAVISLFTDAAHTATTSLGYSKVVNFSVTKEQLAGDLAALSYAAIKAKNLSDLTSGTDV